MARRVGRRGFFASLRALGLASRSMTRVVVKVSLALFVCVVATASPASARPRRALAGRSDGAAYVLPARARGVAARRWSFVVVHHSGTAGGSARAFEAYHRGVRRMARGMAYHFVIGNGRGLGDGEVEAGRRWSLQLPGAHVASALRDGNTGVPLDDVAVGICLVGNNEVAPPTPRQVRALHALVRSLRRAHRIAAERVVGHNEVPGTHTACPGRHTDMPSLRVAPLRANAT